MDPFDFLQDWYLRHCDGDWEHMYGVQIGTLDNPGWSVDIDLAETELEDKSFAPIRRNSESDTNWVVAAVREKKFEARGGPKNLREMLVTFQCWAETCSDISN